MNLRDLLQGAGLTGYGHVADVTVSDVVSDSRKARKNALFVAIDGLNTKGTDHVPAAIDNGAVFVICGRPLPTATPHLVVDDPRAALGQLAHVFWRRPSETLQVVAVTGTNGKTTVASLFAQFAAHAGLRTATIGTLGVITDGEQWPGTMTTPDCADLHRVLAQLRDAGITHVAIEASSHALDQQRLAGVHIAAAAWTNVSRDHLDYHGDMASYAAAKARLFTDVLPTHSPGFVFGDDAACAAVATVPGVEMWSHGQNAAAAHQLAGVCSDAGGTRVRLHSPGRPALLLDTRLPGAFNADNLTAAALLGRAVGLTDAQLTAAASTLVAPAGRLERVPSDIGSLVLVDFAHTPDALQATLRQARAYVQEGARLLCVFGCGGDRDSGKRPEMGRVAGRLADLTLVTSDNPRSESPDKIVAEIAAGLAAEAAFELDRLAPSRIAAVGSRHAFLREIDRAMAIRRAIGNLQPGDVLVIAGKGHEKTQEIAGTKRPFDDVSVARQWLARHRRTGSGRRFGREKPAISGFSFSGADAFRACGGALLLDGARTTSLCTDTRAIVDGCLFVALRGERFDANNFIREALVAGATGIVCSTGCGGEWSELAKDNGAWILEHDDTLKALGDLALAHRTRFLQPVVGITGSNGKTTTKELTALALSAAGSVLATKANHNNRIGVPLTIARIRGGHDYAVVEMGTSEPGEIAELARIGAPTIGVITNIGEAHLEGLGGLTGVATEKSALLKAVHPDGIAIAPADEPLLIEHLQTVAAKVWTFGRSENADIKLVSDIVVDDDRQRFTVDVAGKIVDVALPGIGVHIADNAMAALAVAAAAGVNVYAAASAMGAYRPVGQRMKPTRIGNTLVIEDCYNANPRSTESALTTLSGLPRPQVAALGDMLELGPTAAALHKRVGGFAARVAIDGLVSLGDHADDYVQGARESGLKDAFSASEVPAAVAQITQLLAGGGTLLVKGSRGARMERVIDALKAAHRPTQKKLEVTSVSLAF